MVQSHTIMPMLDVEARQIKTELSLGQLNLVAQSDGNLGEIIERTNAPGDRLNLLSLPTQVSVFNLPSSRIFIVDFPDAEFHGNRFIDLLNQARRQKPEKTPDSRLYLSGCVDDWQMPDKFAASPQGDDLYQRHMRAMPQPFKVFNISDRRKFLYAALPVSQLESENFIQRQLEDLLTAQMANTHVQKAEERCGNASIGVSRIKMSHSRSFQISTQIPFADLSQTSKAIIIESARLASLRGYTVIDPKMEPSILSQGFAGYRHHLPYSVSHLGGGTVEISYGKSKAKYNFRGKWRQPILLDLKEQQDYYILPRQVWAVSKQTGQRLWLDEDLPDQLNEGVDPRANIRLGFILAAVLSDERDLLPDRLSLTPGGYRQPLKEAQMPVLLYLREGDLVRMTGIQHQSQIVDPHLTILNGSYFKSVESSVQ